jgi:hypothetical protein
MQRRFLPPQSFCLTGLALLPLMASAADWTSPYGQGRDGNSPPVETTYSFKSAVHEGSVSPGDIDSLHFHAGYVEVLKLSEDFNWLVGVDWRRFQFSVPAGAPIPTTLQSTALVIGGEWRVTDRWRARLEVLPGVYSDFEDITGEDLNAPFTIEVSYAISDTLTVGGQLLFDARRDSPLVGSAGVTWKFADRWQLSLWLPRPQIEFRATDQVTLFAGASVAGGTYRVAQDFGSKRGRPALDDQAVDYQEVRVGAGFRWRVQNRFNLELAGGWTVDRRFHFHERNLLLNGDGAPYVQASFGLSF